MLSPNSYDRNTSLEVPYKPVFEPDPKYRDPRQFRSSSGFKYCMQLTRKQAIPYHLYNENADYLKYGGPGIN